jgi:DNA-binding response OmpR family regulator
MIPNILAVEDCLDNQALLKIALGHSCNLLFASTLKDAKVTLDNHEVHLILLDINLPDGNGFEFCSTLQSDARTQKIPVIFQTSKAGISDKILGLALGAEDYITKPFDILELRARVESKLRKLKKEDIENTVLRKGQLVFELMTYSLFINDGSLSTRIEMTPIEFKLLLKLARASGHVLSRTQLIDSVWGGTTYVEDRSVDRHVSSIRRKLGKCVSYLHTVPGVGYQFKVAQ